MATGLMKQIATQQAGVVPPSPAPPAATKNPALPPPVLPPVGGQMTPQGSGAVGRTEVPPATPATPGATPDTPDTPATAANPAVVPPPPQPTPATVPPAPAPQEPAPTQPPGEAATAASQAPWYSPDCEPCKVAGLFGFRADGQPCQVCQLKTGIEAKAAAAYTDGSVGYSPPAPGEEEFQSPALPPAATNQKQEATPPPAGTPAVPTPPKPATITTAGQEEIKTHVVGSSPEPKNYILLMGCIPIKIAEGSVQDAQRLFTMGKKEMYQGTGKNIDNLEHFAALTCVDTLVTMVLGNMPETMYISAHPAVSGSLYHRFVDGLREHALSVIVPYGQ